MKKFVLMIMLLNLILIGCGRDSILENRWVNGEELVFEKGKNKPYSGGYTITGYDYNGTKYTSEKGKLKKGKPDGKISYYYNNNTLREEINYKMGIKNGKYKSWDFQGQLNLETNYKNGKLHGDYKEYIHKKLVADLKYRDGEIVEGYKNRYEVPSKDRFYLKKENIYNKNGTEIIREYDDYGMRESISKNGIPISNKSYNRNGSLYSEKNFHSNGNRLEEKYYHDNGNIKKHIYFDEEGNFLKDEVYNQEGELISSHKYK